MKKTFVKRWFGTLLAAALAFAFVPQAVMATEDKDAEEQVAADEAVGGPQDLTDTDLAESGGELATGDYCLIENIVLTEDIIVPEGETVTIDLNGYTLTGSGGSSVVSVYGSLVLEDSSEDKGGRIIGSDERGIYNYGSVAMTGGTISGTGVDGGAVYNDEGAVFEMIDGEISDSRADSAGGGVYNAGTFIMTGGRIIDNFAEGCGGGVYNADGAELTVRDSEICGNVVAAPDGLGGGVYKSAGSVLYIGGVVVIEDNAEVVIEDNADDGGADDIDDGGADDTDDGGADDTDDGSADDIDDGSADDADNSGVDDTGDGSIDGAGDVGSGEIEAGGVFYSVGDDVADNVYLEYAEDSKCVCIVLDGELEEGSFVGVTTDPEAGDPVQITVAESGTDYYMSSAKYFFSDEGYSVLTNRGECCVEILCKSENMTGLYQDQDGNCHYYVGGAIQGDYTGFAAVSAGGWYIENGEVTFEKNSVIKDTTGALGTKGTWYYVTGSQVRYDYTNIADYKNSNGWWYIRDGVVDFDYTGFGSNKNGLWYVEDGKVTFSKNSVIKDTTGAIGKSGTWYYVVGSEVQTDFTGLANYKNSNGWWYIRDGVVDFTVNTVAKNKNGWWYVLDGKVQFDFTGLADYKNSNGWWYIENGKVDFNHNGVDKNKNGWWYVTGGKVQFGFTGLANYKNKNGWWYIQDGAVDFTAQGVYKNVNGWWYVDEGKVDFTFHGMAKNENGWWYIKDGKVDFSFSGTVTAGGVKYTVKNGKVDR